MNLFRMIRPLAHVLPPETAHNLGIFALRHGLLPSSPRVDVPALQVEALGLRFAHPVGLAAGFDKNALAVSGLLRQGFAFVECGTVTPLPQSGNPKPRVFRLHEDQAVINRLGFNNRGMGAFLKHYCNRKHALGVAGVNIGKNKWTEDSLADYVTGLRAVYPHADYVTVNISSPNTQGLRDLQQKDSLEALLGALVREREDCAARHGRHVPMLLKVAPDLSASAREDVARVVIDHHVEGVIVSNTTLSRPDHLRSAHALQAGGLSGKPLMSLSTQALAHFYQLAGHQCVLVGVGGIASAEDAYQKIRAGATLVQLYTALVYQGFGLVHRICEGMQQLLERDGIRHLSEAVGVDAN